MIFGFCDVALEGAGVAKAAYVYPVLGGLLEPDYEVPLEHNQFNVEVMVELVSVVYRQRPSILDNVIKSAVFFQSDELLEIAELGP